MKTISDLRRHLHCLSYMTIDIHFGPDYPLSELAKKSTREMLKVPKMGKKSIQSIGKILVENGYQTDMHKIQKHEVAKSLSITLKYIRRSAISYLGSQHPFTIEVVGKIDEALQRADIEKKENLAMSGRRSTD